MTHDVRARYYEHLAQRNERIIQMHKDGAKAYALARAFALTPQTVYRLLRYAKRGYPLATLGTARVRQPND